MRDESQYEFTIQNEMEKISRDKRMDGWMMNEENKENPFTEI